MKRLKFFSVFLPILVVLLATVSFTGCEKGSAQVTAILPAGPSRTYSSEEMSAVMFKNGINTGTFIMPDKNYVLTTREWIQIEFSAGLSAFQFQMGINNWNAESNDCDKFASATTFYAKWLNHSTPNRKVLASLACGEVYYTQQKNSQNHAINFFIVKSGEELKILFYEPQTKRFVTLTQAEIFSIYFWKL